MKRVRLVTKEDPETGSMGLVLKGLHISDQPFVATDGLQIAHDLLEHQNGQDAIGGIADEMQALGAIWYVRGQFGALRLDGAGSRYSVEENIASDFVRMFRDHCYGQPLELATPRVHRCNNIAEAAFGAILDCVKRDALSEIDAEDHKAAHRQLRPYLHAALRHMRAGYRKAARRFKGDAQATNNLFWSIAKAIDPYAKHPEYEGQEFELSYDFATGKAWCEEFYPEEDY